MNTHGPLILQVDRLEERTCPSLFGPMTMADANDAEGSIDANAPADIVPWGTESTEDPYDWIMMVMNPDQMMELANEYDQSAASPLMLSPVKLVTETIAGMTSQADMPETAGESMGESEAMPPAQMVMEQPLRVRRALSPSKSAATMEMTDSDSAEASSENIPDDAAKKPGQDSGAPKADQPPMLSPGELELRVDPQLRPGRIEPELEEAQPSGSPSSIDRNE